MEAKKENQEEIKRPSCESGQFGLARVRHAAPHFEGIAWDPSAGFKKLNFKDYLGSYLVLFFYPMDFTFVCPTEILEFSRLYDSFKETKCEVIGCSGDSQFVHMEYTSKPRARGGLGPVKMPLMADSSHKIAKAYGAYISDGDEEGVCLRSTYIIDANGVIRHISQNDLPVGRNVEEVLRLVQAFQYTDIHGEVCPSGWKKGAKTMVPDHKSEKTQKYWEEEMAKKEA